MKRATAGFLLVAGAALSCRSSSKGTGAPTPPPPSTSVPSPPVLEETMVCPAAIVEARSGGALPNKFIAPSEDDRARMKALFGRVLDGAALAEVRADAAKFGFELIEPPDLAGTVVLREVASARHGGGAYVVRLGSSSRLVVQAPHTFYDEGTLPIACALFGHAQARALFVNTVHRYRGAAQDGHGNYPADVAHAPATLFQAATEGAIATIRPITVVQVHGFATREPRARAVVSSGEKRAGAALVGRVAKALDGAAGSPVLRYPDDTTELGATTNVQGTVVRAAGGRFVHIEMEETLRKELQDDAAVRGRFFVALTGALEEK
jgi:hypothetical protein